MSEAKGLLAEADCSELWSILPMPNTSREANDSDLSHVLTHAVYSGHNQQYAIYFTSLNFFNFTLLYLNLLCITSLLYV